MAPNLTKLRELGFKPGEDRLFESALTVIEEQGHTHASITPTFVLELARMSYRKSIAGRQKS